MASTFSQTLRLELIGDGDQSGIWGQTTNTNLGTLLEQAITGVVDITMADANYTLTNFNGVSDEARNAVLVVGGTNAAVRDIIAPLVKKLYVVKNNTVGGYAVIIRGSSGASVSVPNGGTVWVYCDGTNFNAIGTETVGNFEVNGNLTVTGDSSATNFTGAGLTITSINASNITAGTISNARTTASSANGASTLVVRDVSGNFAANAITAVTQAVTTNNTTLATTAFVRSIIPAGIISMWSGSIATIPTGWALCDGTNGTPNLRDKFIVGAGSTYAVGATGGSANATLVAHTHTFSGNTGTMSQNATHNHGITDPSHSHGIDGTFLLYGQVTNDSGVLVQTGSGNTFAASTGITVNNTNIDHTHAYSGTTASTGSSATNANLPPYYALAYIMKL